MSTTDCSREQILFLNKVKEIAHITKLAKVILKKDYNDNLELWLDAIIKGFLCKNINYVEQIDYTVTDSSKFIEEIISEYVCLCEKLQSHLCINKVEINNLMEDMKRFVEGTNNKKVETNPNMQKLEEISINNIQLFKQFLFYFSDSASLPMTARFYKELNKIIESIRVVVKMKKTVNLTKKKTTSNVDEVDNVKKIKHNSSIQLENSISSKMNDTNTNLSHMQYCKLKNDLKGVIGAKYIHIEIVNKNTFYCTVCQCLLQSISDVCNHVKEKHERSATKKETKNVPNFTDVEATNAISKNNDTSFMNNCSVTTENNVNPDNIVKAWRISFKNNRNVKESITTSDDLKKIIGNESACLTVMEKNQLVCEICSCYLNINDAKAHINSKRHSKKKKKQSNKQNVISKTIPDVNISQIDLKALLNDKHVANTKFKNFYCKLCCLRIKPGTPEEALKHIKGNRHNQLKIQLENVNVNKAPLLKSKLLDDNFIVRLADTSYYYCRACQQTLPSNSYVRDHLLNCKHNERINNLQD